MTDPVSFGRSRPVSIASNSASRSKLSSRTIFSSMTGVPASFSPPSIRVGPTAVMLASPSTRTNGRPPMKSGERSATSSPSEARSTSHTRCGSSIDQWAPLVRAYSSVQQSRQSGRIPGGRSKPDRSGFQSPNTRRYECPSRSSPHRLHLLRSGISGTLGSRSTVVSDRATSSPDRSLDTLITSEARR